MLLRIYRVLSVFSRARERVFLCLFPMIFLRQSFLSFCTGSYFVLFSPSRGLELYLLHSRQQEVPAWGSVHGILCMIPWFVHKRNMDSCRVLAKASTILLFNTALGQERLHWVRRGFCLEPMCTHIRDHSGLECFVY